MDSPPSTGREYVFEWVDCNFYGYWIAAHLSPDEADGRHLDPSGNAIEFKAFADMGSLFAK